MAYELWAWLEEDGDGGDGMIAALVPGTSFVGPLQHRTRALAEALEPIARKHGLTYGRPVRLAHLVETDS